ncbi:MAG TPA: thiopeptide-type bacteriocin biosynthesis protein, partial [Thermoanaerobaculia bacterium]|nr:thiopeptide-type bacteriocin biosynthesis protein [Thermoanaerobaculia bacterium]
MSWLAFHLHYHERQDQILEELVHPLVASLVRRGEIDSFFFVRYALGGPHIRLRIRLCGNGQAAVAEVLGAAERFFEACPSRATLPEEKILAINRSVLKSDPSESDEAVYPDNFVRQAPYAPEIERYGGPELFPESLAFFAISSCRVLRWLHEKAGSSGSNLSFAFHLL